MCIIQFNQHNNALDRQDYSSPCSRRGAETSKHLLIVAQTASGDIQYTALVWAMTAKLFLSGWVEGLSLWRYTWRRYEHAKLHNWVPGAFLFTHDNVSSYVCVPRERVLWAVLKWLPEWSLPWGPGVVSYWAGVGRQPGTLWKALFVRETPPLCFSLSLHEMRLPGAWGELITHCWCLGAG